MEEEIKQKNTRREQFLDPVTGRFRPGNPGGPGKKPGTISLVELLKKKLLEVEPTQKRTYASLFIEEVLAKALKKKDVVMMRDILNRVDGLPKQTIDLAGELNQIQSIELEEQTQKLVEEFIKWRKKTNK
jgi:hypothetical protein